MNVDRGVFPVLLFGTFAVAILAFMVRGFGQLVVGREMAQLLAAPLFVLGIGMAVLAFVLSILVVSGLLDASE